MSSSRVALLWSFAERYASLVISIGSTMLLARLLTPAQVGIYSVCAAVTTVAGILRDFGVSEYLIQEKELNRDKIRAAFGVAIIIAWTIGSAVFLSRGWIAEYLGEPGVAEVLAVLALNFLILPLSSPAFALMNRELAFRPIFALQVSCNAVSASVTVFLAFKGYGYMALAWGPVINVLTQTLILAWTRPAQSFMIPGFKEARTVLRFGSMYVSSRVVEVLSRNFHEPIIAKKFGFEAVGLFSRAYGLIDLFHMNIGAAVLRVATPAFAAEHRANRPVADAFSRSTAIFTSISWPFFGFIALASHEVVLVMFGAQWTAAAPLATILAITALPWGPLTLVPQMLSATGHVGRRLKVALLICPIHMALVYLGSLFDLHAVAAAWLLSNTAMLLLYLRHLREALGISAAQIFRPCVGSAVVALTSTGVMALALSLARQLAFPELLSILFTLLAGAVTWLLVVRNLSHPVLAEVNRFIASARQRLQHG